MGFYKEWHSAVSALAKDLRTQAVVRMPVASLFPDPI